MKRDTKLKKMRFSVIVSVVPEGKDEFEELIRAEEEGDTVAAAEAGAIQDFLEPALRRMISAGRAPGLRRTLTRAPLEPPSKPAATPPKQLPPKKTPPKKGGNGSNGSN